MFGPGFRSVAGSLFLSLKLSAPAGGSPQGSERPAFSGPTREVRVLSLWKSEGEFYIPPPLASLLMHVLGKQISLYLALNLGNEEH